MNLIGSSCRVVARLESRFQFIQQERQIVWFSVGRSEITRSFFFLSFDFGKDSRPVSRRGVGVNSWGQQVGNCLLVCNETVFQFQVVKGGMSVFAFYFLDDLPDLLRRDLKVERRDKLFPRFTPAGLKDVPRFRPEHLVRSNVLCCWSAKDHTLSFFPLRTNILALFIKPWRFWKSRSFARDWYRCFGTIKNDWSQSRSRIFTVNSSQVMWLIAQPTTEAISWLQHVKKPCTKLKTSNKF